MIVEEKVQELLVAALPGYGDPAQVPLDRIRVPGNWQGLARPYVIHESESPDPRYTHSERQALTEWRYRVTSFGDSYSAALAVSRAVVEILDGNHDGVQFFWRGRAKQPVADDLNVIGMVDFFDVWSV